MAVSPNTEVLNEKSDDIRILIIDDNELFCQLLTDMIVRMGMTAACELSVKKGLQTAETGLFDVILLDVNLPDGCGLDIIPRLRQSVLPPEIIIMTSFGDEDGAEIAIQNHAWDYIAKGTSLQNLELSLSRAIQYRQQKKSAVSHIVLERGGIIGKSALIISCLERTSQAAMTDAPVLILGETGTGKEVFAKTIHENSRRAKGDFVVVDCGALPDHLVESTLFGHKKGAFTSADADRIGLVEQAHRGTLFLDEIGELPEEIQKKFLRVLQEKKFRPLGSKREVASDFRLICATNRDLSEMTENGRFRKDLFYRICAIAIELPPLRTRPEDIAGLVDHNMKQHYSLTGTRPHQISPDVMEALQAYSWPGNVRELINTIDCLNAEVPLESEIFPRHLPNHIRAEVARNRIKASNRLPKNKHAPDSDTDDNDLIPLKELLERTRYNYIKNLIDFTGGDITKALGISKLSRGHLYDLMKKFKIRS